MMEIALFIENLKRENETYLAVFQDYLEKFGVSEKLISTYIYNTEMYLNDFLAEECQKQMVSGIRELDVFFKEYYANWLPYATEGRMERIIKSLKMFYRCMHDLGYIDNKMYAFFEWIVKENKQEWIESFREWNRIEEEMALEALGNE